MKNEEEIKQLIEELEECSDNPNIDDHIGGLGALLIDASETIKILNNQVNDLANKYIN